MKKYLLVVLCAVLLLTVTGCGKSKKVVCSKSETEDGQTMTLEIAAEFDKNDKVVDASVTYDFGSKELADTYCSLFKMASESTDAITCDGTKITIKGLDNIDEEDETEDSEKLAGKTRDEFIKMAKEEGYTCK